MTYTIDYFLDKFSKIPERFWMTLGYSFGDQCCSLGHCGARACMPTDESDALIRLFENIGAHPATVNDGKDILRYYQTTPRQRILAALLDIKALQEKETPKVEIVPEVKERIVYVMRDAKVRELSKAELSEQ